jgi:hypothetical protein
MKIAIVYPTLLPLAWDVSGGIVHTLRKLGHLVMEMPQSIECHTSVNWWSRLDEINAGDLFLLIAPEWAIEGDGYCGYHNAEPKPKIDSILSMIKIKKAALFTENQVVDDGKKTFDFKQIASMFDFNFFITAQEAALTGGLWLPPAVDTDMFHPTGQLRTIEIAAPGTSWSESKRDFLYRYSQIASPQYIPVVGKCIVENLDGISLYETAKLLAYDYNRVKIVVSLPPWKNHVPTFLPLRATDAMACGCCVLTPVLRGAAAENSKFINGVDLFYYEPTPAGLLETLLRVIDKPEKRDAVAARAPLAIQDGNTLEQRMETMLSVCS